MTNKRLQKSEFIVYWLNRINLMAIKIRHNFMTRKSMYISGLKNQA